MRPYKAVLLDEFQCREMCCKALSCTAGFDVSRRRWVEEEEQWASLTLPCLVMAPGYGNPWRESTCTHHEYGCGLAQGHLSHPVAPVSSGQADIYFNSVFTKIQQYLLVFRDERSPIYKNKYENVLCPSWWGENKLGRRKNAEFGHVQISPPHLLLIPLALDFPPMLTVSSPYRLVCNSLISALLLWL